MKVLGLGVVIFTHHIQAETTDGHHHSARCTTPWAAESTGRSNTAANPDTADRAGTVFSNTVSFTCSACGISDKDDLNLFMVLRKPLLLTTLSFALAWCIMRSDALPVALSLDEMDDDRVGFCESVVEYLSVDDDGGGGDDDDEPVLFAAVDAEAEAEAEVDAGADAEPAAEFLTDPEPTFSNVFFPFHFSIKILGNRNVY
mmetsp:Transcript_17896/g.31107  ORF Transcript_17896/g.31107 Transcript_17896/m.31107 type:complete len:201 (-) Transcript_17896:493-1095(-)